MDTVDYRAKLGQALDMIARLRAQLEERERAAKAPIAIVGMGCRFPGGGHTPEAFWRMLRDGVDAVSRFPRDRWDTAESYYDPDPDAPGKAYCLEGGFLDEIDTFDPALFGISPAEAVAMDPQQRMALEVSWEALERAGIAPDSLDGSATGVFVGASTSDYVRLRQQYSAPSDVDPYQLMGENQFIAGRISFTYGLHGPSQVVDTACSSSLVAVHLACQSLRSGECDLALAGGVNALLSPYSFVLASKARALAPDGRCKPFAATADGYARGEGCGIVVLKRLPDALADGDDVVAMIHGTAVNHDGRSSGISVPNGLAQQAVIRAALADGGVAPDRIGYVEAHGTGTVLGDPIELRALEAVLSGQRPADQPYYVGSVKANVAHLEAAAGIAGLIKAALCLRHREIPPHLHFTSPNPNVDWNRLHVAIPTQPVSWPEREGGRCAGVSSFGVSGTNAHIVLGEAPAPPAPPARVSDHPHELLALSAKTDTALRELAGRYAAHLADHDEVPLEAVCRSATQGRAQLAHRLALVAESTGALREQLDRFARGEPAPGVVTGRAGSRQRAKVAFLFTGQGSQYPGMGRGLYDCEPVFRKAMDQCAELLRAHLDRPLLDVLYPGDQAEPALDQTMYTQPALFAVEYALAELWRSWGVRPSAVMGHSVGEYVAACVAGALSLEDALRLIATRARLMQSVPAAGAMVSVGLREDQAAAEVAAYGGGVSIAAVNGDADVALSGAADAVEDLVARLQARGTSVRRLRVSHAFHSPLVDPILDELRSAAAAVTVSPPRLTLVCNLTGAVADAGTLADPDYWRHHARQPVRFRDGMRALDELGFTAFLEVGPGRTMLGMGAKCLPGTDRTWIASLRRGTADTDQIRRALASLYALGAPIDWAGVYAGVARQPVPLPTYPFQRTRYWFTVRQAPPPGPAAAVSDAAGDSQPQAEDVPVLLGRLGEADPATRPLLLAAYLREQLATALWTPAEDIETDADLLELGADSLMIMQIVTACKSDLQITVSPGELFACPTIDEWASFLTGVVEREHALAGAGERGAATSAIDWTSTAVLRQEAVLDPEIRPSAPLVENWRNPSAVFLTGATGFIGAFLLDELLRATDATIYCLVRCADPKGGLQRLRSNSERYLPWRGEDEERIVVVPGDLAKPLFGLTESDFDGLATKIDAIYHNGTMVNFMHTYRQLRTPNVRGTEEVLRLACRGPLKPVNYVSTFAIWGVPDDLASVFAEDDDLDRAGRLPNGYLQTKWVAENLVVAARERGVPVNVYRLGQIQGDSRFGACLTTSFTCAVIKGCIQLGFAPKLDMLVEMTPVDYVSRALVYISTTTDDFGQSFHLLNPQRITFDEMIHNIQRRGWPVEQIDGEAFVARLRADLGTDRRNELHPLIDTISEMVAVGQDRTSYKVDALHKALEGSGITCPALDETLLDTYFDWLIRTGFLDEPPTP